jgi:hypothetical protein
MLCSAIAQIPRKVLGFAARLRQPRTWAGAAAKLRLACDKDLGLPSILDAAQPELLNIQQVLAFAERQVTV